MEINTTALKEKCAALRKTLQRILPRPGDYATGIDGLTLYRREHTNIPQEEGYAVPHVTIVFQGAESVRINGREFLCGECQCRMTSEDSFGTGHIADASSERPFLAASLKLDLKLLRELVKTIPANYGADVSEFRTVSVETADTDILDAFHRLVMLHKKPTRISVLAPLIIYEIHYLLVAGTYGAKLA
jgi:hypothetical protein